MAILSGCSTRQAEINRLHTALAAEQQVQNFWGRDFQNVNTEIDRFNHAALARLEELER